MMWYPAPLPLFKMSSSSSSLISIILVLCCCTLILLSSPSHAAFSSGGRLNSNSNGNQPPKPSFTLSDRFKATCPADINAIVQFDASLVSENEILASQENQNMAGTTPTLTSTWVAIYRSSNNLPSVLIKDEFRNAMRIATSIQTDVDLSSSSSAITSSSSTSMNDLFLSSQIETSSREKSKKISSGNESSKGIRAQTPVAVAKLSPSEEFQGCWVMEHMRCSLRKEDINDACDGNSEHAEAISICIDELMLHHLQMGRKFDDGVIRAKATIHQGRLLEDRGFEEVQELSRDMATHVSSLDASLIKYAERAVETLSKSPGARDRALKILNLLGRQEPSSRMKKKREGQEQSNTSRSSDDGDDDGYDPWASIKRFI